MMLLKIFFGYFIVSSVSCDVYLHNPRGSNNRWNENTRPRRNPNRMFDSQNNDRGGYNVGSLYYYVGSTLQIEWTNQHSCGDQNNHCDIILQYMCGNQVRDGTSTATIPSNPVQCKGLDCNEDRRYGMHEDFYSYTHCRMRTRNKGLFTADQKVKDFAINTRQNPQGTRRGYECPEERDYYPYWGPTPWKDIAILTNDLSRCPMYLAESQNVKEKYACKVDQTYLYQNSEKKPKKPIPIDKEACEEWFDEKNKKRINATWERFDSHGISPPACVAAPMSRDNHLGNGLGGQHLSYNWTIPDDVNDHCALRIRYNISTADYDRDTTTSKENTKPDENIGVDLWTRQGLTKGDGNARGYTFKNNPEVKIFGSNDNNLGLQLAINTAQFGRTFQDRSHTFSIQARGADVSSHAKIQNINVRGKRGNIVQVYPAVEYDFVPNTVVAGTGSYVHFQWTGSDNNPGNNDGQGRARTDRSNAILMADSSYIEGRPDTRTNWFGQLGVNYPNVLSRGSFAGFDWNSRLALAILKPHIGGDMTQLNDAGTYFDHGLRSITMPGVYHYMCTRNNNFSNRSQKGKLIVTNALFSGQTVDQNGAIITVKNPSQKIVASANILSGSLLSYSLFIELWKIPIDDFTFYSSPPNTDYISDVVLLVPAEVITDSEDQIILQFELSENPGFLYHICIYRSNNLKKWEKITPYKITNGIVSLLTDRGGYFVAGKTLNGGAIAGLAIGLIVLVVILIVGFVVLFRYKRYCKGYGGKI